ncbi:MAG: hypothetical protein V4587_01570 [Acidobacteriota bacterium]
MKSFKVFGEPVEILAMGGITGGLSTTLLQASLSAGGRRRIHSSAKMKPFSCWLTAQA